jgi:hypothetical protein
MKLFNRSAGLLFAGCFILLLSCRQSASGPNILSSNEKEEGWQLLFDGKTTDGWHLYNEGKVASTWIVADGILKCDPQTKQVTHGDLVTDRSFTNYDLKFEWSITEAGNSGVFINVQEDTAYVRAWVTGPEYQLLDNANVKDHNYNDPKRMSGALYGLVEIKNNAKPHAAGEWNQGRIMQQDGKITYWLNDVITAEEDLKSARWKQIVDSSGLAKYPAFGKATSGKIALQEWAKGVSFRNIKIRELP